MTSSVWARVCSSLGIYASTTTVFHPQSNGTIERFHCSLKSALPSQLAGSDWFLHLSLVLLGLRTVPKDDTSLSVSKAVYGSPLTLPGEFLGSPELPPSSFLFFNHTPWYRSTPCLLIVSKQFAKKLCNHHKFFFLIPTSFQPDDISL